MNDDNKKINKLETELEVLKERVEQYQQKNAIRFSSYRNYALIIFTLISLIGIGAFKYIVEGISSEAAREEASKGVHEILNEDYISIEIKEKSSEALQNIIAEAEKKAKEIVSLGYSFNNYVKYGLDIAYYNRDESIERFDKAFKIWESFSNIFPDGDSFFFLSCYAEIQSINNRYDSAIETCNLAKKYTKRQEEIALILIYEIMNLRLSDKDSTDLIEEFNKTLGVIRNGVYLHWSFNLFASYIQDDKNKVKEEDKKLYFELTDMIKKKVRFP